MAHGMNGRPMDPGIRLVLEELRDFRKEARDDRRQAAADRREAAADRRRSDERFERIIQEFREDSARRDAVMDKRFRQIHVVGVAILKTLERIERNTGIRRNGRPNNGR